jgi:hypothetical protein
MRARIMKSGPGSVKRHCLLANVCKWSTATTHLRCSRRRTTSENSGMILNDYLELFLATEISCDRNTPTDKSKSPITFNNITELYNQWSIYIGKNHYCPTGKSGRKYGKTVSQNTLCEQSRNTQMWMWLAQFRNGMRRERKMRVRSRQLQFHQCLDRKLLTNTDN